MDSIAPKYKYKSIPHIMAVVLLLLFCSCKTAKTITGKEASLNLTTKQLIRENAKKAATFNTLQSKLKITYTQGDDTQSYTVNYRMEKDKVLWMSAPLGIVRAMITPNRVAFYNKLDNTYFDGDFSYLSELLGTPLNFNQVQNIILGETLFGLEENPMTSSTHDGSYVLQPKEQQQLFEIFYLIYPDLLKVKSQQLSQNTQQKHLQIDYLAYQNVDNQVLPEQVKVIAVEADKEFIAELEFKSVTLNEDLRFPFSIPTGYKKIVL